MRLTTFLIIISTLTISAKSYSQKVTLSLQNVPVEKVFRQIREQTGYSFLWAQQTLKDLPTVSVFIRGASLKEAVKACLKGLPLAYGIRGNVVYIERKIVTPLTISPSIRSPILPLNVVIGLVTDSTGAPLPGVTVYVKGNTKIGTTTDANGRYVLQVPDNATLVFSMIGFASQEVAVNGRSAINVQLLPATNKLGVTVVTAFGRKQRKEAVVGAVTTIRPSELRTPSSNLTTALAGRIAGIISFQRSGQPGMDNASFFIRGVTTFGYKQDPLILVDNVELSANDLARLQVDDIESFSILKDASATALYGARGANGVILITTKEGQEGKARIHLRVENSVSEPTQNLKLANPVTYMNSYNEALTTRNPLAAPLFTHDKIAGTQAVLDHVPGNNPYIYPAVDWMDLLFKKASTSQRADFDASGGTQFAKYYISGSYSLDNGILNTSSVNNTNKNNVKFRNYQLRANVNINATKTTEVVVRLWGNFNEYNGPISNNGLATDLYSKVLHTSPVLFPAFYAPDSANAYAKHILFGNSLSGSSTVGYDNPYADLMKGYQSFSESRMSAQFEVNQDLGFVTKGLTFHGLFSTNRYSYFSLIRQYNPFYYDIGSYDAKTNQYFLAWLNQAPGDATEYLNYVPGSTSVNTYLYFQGNLSYNRDFGHHSIDASLIATREQTLNPDAVNPSTGQPDLQYTLPYRNIGFAGSASYAYMHRYFLQFNFGLNGSERFSADHRWGFFPTIGAAWVISNEKFWDAGIANIVSRLKVRGSYGLVGNDAIGSQRFFYLSNVNLNGGNPASFGYTNNNTLNGVTIYNYSNPNVTWETSRQLNLGIEATFLQNIDVVADFYKQYRYNILMNRASVPNSMGLEAPISANVGTAYSKGVDLSVDYRQNITSNLWAAIRANLTATANKYGHFEEPEYKEPWRYLSGQPINQTFGYIAERLFVDDKEAASSPAQLFNAGSAAPMGGDIKYRDVNGDGKITQADMVPIGLPTTPQIVYGFGFSVGWKYFDLSAFFQGLARESFILDATALSPFLASGDGSGTTQLLQQFADDHWSEENQSLYALYPRFGTTESVIDNNLQPSTWWLRNGNFLRLKSLEVGFTLPEKLTKRIFLDKCRIYFNGLNLMTWSAFKMWDPELAGNGFAYPIQKTFNVGLDINF